MPKKTETKPKKTASKPKSRRTRAVVEAELEGVSGKLAAANWRIEKLKEKLARLKDVGVDQRIVAADRNQPVLDVVTTNISARIAAGIIASGIVILLVGIYGLAALLQ